MGGGSRLSVAPTLRISSHTNAKYSFLQNSAGQVSVPAWSLCDHVHGPPLDHSPVRWVFHRRGVQCFLPQVSQMRRGLGIRVGSFLMIAGGAFMCSL